jgi:tetratricopeptide (TPR) repeat protein
MALRRGWMVLGLMCLGCHVYPWPEGEPDDQTTAERPVGFFEPILATDPPATRSPLSRAAECLRNGDEAGACKLLGEYLTAQPDHHEVRIHHAELLLHLGRMGEAREQFERCIAQAQDRGDQTRPQQLRCHSLLMEIADAEDDYYGVRLHRGIGLYLLGLQRAELADADERLPAEALLCRAASELTKARVQRPAEARPCWYLHQVWSALGQRTAALRWLRRAEQAAAFSALTPAEQRGLQLALRGADPQTVHP